MAFHSSHWRSAPYAVDRERIGQYAEARHLDGRIMSADYHQFRGGLANRQLSTPQLTGPRSFAANLSLVTPYADVMALERKSQMDSLKNREVPSSPAVAELVGQGYNKYEAKAIVHGGDAAGSAGHGGGVVRMAAAPRAARAWSMPCSARPAPMSSGEAAARAAYDSLYGGGLSEAAAAADYPSVPVQAMHGYPNGFAVNKHTRRGSMPPAPANLGTYDAQGFLTDGKGNRLPVVAPHRGAAMRIGASGRAVPGAPYEQSNADMLPAGGKPWAMPKGSVCWGDEQSRWCPSGNLAPRGPRQVVEREKGDQVSCSHLSDHFLAYDTNAQAYRCTTCPPGFRPANCDCVANKQSPPKVTHAGGKAGGRSVSA